MLLRLLLEAVAAAFIAMTAYAAVTNSGTADPIAECGTACAIAADKGDPR